MGLLALTEWGRRRINDGEDIHYKIAPNPGAFRKA
jgi:hypothetical protein